MSYTEIENEALRARLKEATAIMTETEEVLVKIIKKTCTKDDLVILKNHIIDFKTK